MRLGKERSTALIAFLVSCPNIAFGSPFPGTIIERHEDLLKAYDYVVVGGGVSGLVVANRLTEDPDTTVLVIEAGKIDNYSPVVQYPRYFALAGTNYSWPITSLPIPGLNNRTSMVPSARVVGGGSAINGMAFDRGAPGDYDLWGEIIGDHTWSWKGLLPYFIKSETFTPPTPEQQEELGISYDMSVHGTTGPVQASFPPFIYNTGKAFMDAFRQLGIPVQKDGGANALGAFWYPNSLNPTTRERSYARTTYHELSNKRPNYHLLPETLVAKLTPDLSAVEYIPNYNASLTTSPPNTQTRKIKAKKEIILAAGAVHTPKILQLSGIASSSILQPLGIKQIIDLPGVGENLQDHPVQYAYMTLNLTDPTQDASYLSTNATYDAEMGALYASHQTGPWTVSTGNTFAFLTAEHLNFSSSNFITSATQSSGQFLRPGLDKRVVRGYERLKANMLSYMSANKVALTENLFGGLTCLQKPLSRGSIHISSSDPYAMPLVDYRTFSNPLDIEMLVHSVRFNTDLLPQTDAFKSMGAVMMSPAPGMGETELRELVRGSAAPSFAHPSGTCAMGRREEGGCVDASLRLYGARGRVRVVDASVMPVLPGAHTQSTVYAVAEKAADLIQGGHRR